MTRTSSVIGRLVTEGWNNWRVSTMGLMNIGRSEGSEIVQLFGRGVRLKGYDFCLKRSSEVREVKKPEFMRLCETLNIFGVRADYMQQFKEYLEEEGLPQDMEEMVLPVIKNLGKEGSSQGPAGKFRCLSWGYLATHLGPKMQPSTHSKQQRTLGLNILEDKVRISGNEAFIEE